uniref:Uncharacterized protein n=1 Tax=Glossina palpalis gambiensis TaxID=67801 RepID=A0A1B0BQ91_9MUSC
MINCRLSEKYWKYIPCGSRSFSRKKGKEERGIEFLYSGVYNVPDRNDQDDDEGDGDYGEDPGSTECNYQLMEKQHQLEKMKTENSINEKIPIVINATKRDISSSEESGTQDDVLEHDSDRMFLLNLSLYLHKVGDQEKQKVLLKRGRGGYSFLLADKKSSGFQSDGKRFEACLEANDITFTSRTSVVTLNDECLASAREKC